MRVSCEFMEADVDEHKCLKQIKLVNLPQSCAKYSELPLLYRSTMWFLWSVLLHFMFRFLNSCEDLIHFKTFSKVNLF